MKHKGGRILTLQDMYLVPGLAIKLVSVNPLTASGYKAIFTHNNGEVKNKKGKVLKLVRLNKAWTFPSVSQVSDVTVCVSH